MSALSSSGLNITTPRYPLHVKSEEEKRTMRVRAFVVTAVLALVGASPVLAGHSWVQSSGFVAHWEAPGTTFRTVTVRDATTTPWPGFISEGASDWDVGSSKITYQLSAGTGGCAQAAYEVKVCNLNPQPSQLCGNAVPATPTTRGWVGCTYTFWDLADKDHFTAVVLYLNDDVGTYWTTARRAHVACHELGHALGLAHRTPETNTCMWDPIDPGYQEPDSHDFGQLDSSIYLHADNCCAPQEESGLYGSGSIAVVDDPLSVSFGTASFFPLSVSQRFESTEPEHSH